MTAVALILEDSKTQALIIAKMIEAQGWQSIHFDQMRDASDALTQMSVQALFLDVFVGIHNTLQHIDRFRKLAPDVPIVLMTAGASHEAIEDTLKNARKTGADYVLRKPFNETMLKDVLATLSPDGGKRRKHILVIDDSSTVRTIAVRALEGGGYRVSQAASMEEAFSNVDIAHVDLVLCDVFMPGMGGLQGMRTIKGTWPRVTIVSMSAGIVDKVSEQEALNATRRLGADAQIAKPFAPEDLVELTGAMLGLAA